MKTLAHHIEHVRNRPPHIRKQVTFALALGATAIIALLWLVISLSTGAFHIQATSFADAAAEGNATTATAPSNDTSLLGAAAAAFGATTTPAQLQVVNANTPAPPTNAADTQTVIPF